MSAQRKKILSGVKGKMICGNRYNPNSCVSLSHPGIPGNVIVVFLFGYQKQMRRPFDVYVVSLAVADVTASFFVPIVTIHDLWTDLRHWKLLGNVGCKLFVSIDHMTMLASVFTLLVISIERVRWGKMNASTFSKL